MLFWLCALVSVLVSWTVTGFVIARDVRLEHREALDALNREYRDLCEADPIR